MLHNEHLPLHAFLSPLSLLIACRTTWEQHQHSPQPLRSSQEHVMAPSLSDVFSLPRTLTSALPNDDANACRAHSPLGALPLAALAQQWSRLCAPVLPSHTCSDRSHTRLKVRGAHWLAALWRCRSLRGPRPATSSQATQRLAECFHKHSCLVRTLSAAGRAVAEVDTPPACDAIRSLCAQTVWHLSDFFSHWEGTVPHLVRFAALQLCHAVVDVYATLAAMEAPVLADPACCAAWPRLLSCLSPHIPHTSSADAAEDNFHLDAQGAVQSYALLTWRLVQVAFTDAFREVAPLLSQLGTALLRWAVEALTRACAELSCVRQDVTEGAPLELCVLCREHTIAIPLNVAYLYFSQGEHGTPHFNTANQNDLDVALTTLMTLSCRGTAVHHTCKQSHAAWHVLRELAHAATLQPTASDPSTPSSASGPRSASMASVTISSWIGKDGQDEATAVPLDEDGLDWVDVQRIAAQAVEAFWASQPEGSRCFASPENVLEYTHKDN